MSVYQQIAPVAKAVTGAVVAGLAALGTALTDGGVSPAEWVAVVSATLVASYAVWQVPNETTEAAVANQAEDLEEDEGLYLDGH